jgi:hypothetical protein
MWAAAIVFVTVDFKFTIGSGLGIGVDIHVASKFLVIASARKWAGLVGAGCVGVAVIAAVLAVAFIQVCAYSWVSSLGLGETRVADALIVSDQVVASSVLVAYSTSNVAFIDISAQARIAKLHVLVSGVT